MYASFVFPPQLALASNIDMEQRQLRSAARVYCGAVQDAIVDGNSVLAHAALHNLATLLHIPHTHPAPSDLSTLSTEESEMLAHVQQAGAHLQHIEGDVPNTIWTHHFTTLADVLLTGM